ncbi:MAG: SGNH/GDSL hydrolase family protein [Actinobacteria bacterium]|nr:SGNH/GDSL hydrolase family protein [Actinomycetota bacterium]
MSPSPLLQAPRDWHPEPFRLLVTLGESTTAGGWSSVRERCWANVLAALISDFQDEPVRLVNSGIGANVISTRVPGYERSGKPAANERIQKHVIDHQPDLLVVAYGLNDARGGTPLELFRHELIEVLVSIRRGCDPLIVLVGPYPITDFQRYPDWTHATPEILETFNLAIAQVARDQHCLFSDVLSAYRTAPWAVHNDGVHANDLGHRLIAHEVFKTLAQHCSGLAVRTQRLEQTSERWRDESVLKADYGYASPRPS